MDVVAAIGDTESVVEEGASAASETFMSKLGKRVGLPEEVLKVFLMSFGCFLDAVSDVVFQASLMVPDLPYGASDDIRYCDSDIPFEEQEKSTSCVSISFEWLTTNGPWDSSCSFEVDGLPSTSCPWDVFSKGGSHDEVMSAVIAFQGGHISEIAKYLLIVLCIKEFMKIVPFMHSYVSPYFHDPKNFQTLHNSPLSFGVILFSKRWRRIAEESVQFERSSPSIIHILVDVLVEDIPQLVFSIYIVVVGLRIPCFLTHDPGDHDVSNFCPKTAAPFETSYSEYTSVPCTGPPTSFEYKLYGTTCENREHDCVAVFSQGSIDEVLFGGRCCYEAPNPDANGHFGSLSWTGFGEVNGVNSCSSKYSEQSSFPFCGCEGGLGGGGIDGLWMFSFAMTLISTAAKTWKLISNIRKRKANIEKNYRQTGGARVEMTARTNYSAVPQAERLDEMASLISSLQMKSAEDDRWRKEVEGRVSMLEKSAALPTQKNAIGERLYALIHATQPELAGKITGMLLELDNGELQHLLENSEALKSKIVEAIIFLDSHNRSARLVRGKAL